MPAPQVFPWARYAEVWAKNLAELIKNMSPAERQRRAAEISLMQSKVNQEAAKAREAQAVAEIRELTAHHARDHINQIGDANDYLRSLYHGKSGSLGEDTQHKIEPAPPDLADTSVPDYYGGFSQTPEEPGPPKDEPTDLPEGEDILPNDNETE